MSKEIAQIEITVIDKATRNIRLFAEAVERLILDIKAMKYIKNIRMMTDFE